MKDSKMFKRILRYMKPHFLNYVIAVLLTGVVVLCDILSPIIIGKSLDVISEPKIDINILILLFAASIVIAIIQSILQYCQTMLLQHTGQNIVFNMRKEVFSHIQKLSHNARGNGGC